MTSVAPIMQSSVALNLVEFTFWEKTLKGALYGTSSPRYQIPHLLE